MHGRRLKALEALQRLWRLRLQPLRALQRLLLRQQRRQLLCTCAPARPASQLQPRSGRQRSARLRLSGPARDS